MCININVFRVYKYHQYPSKYLPHMFKDLRHLDIDFGMLEV